MRRTFSEELIFDELRYLQRRAAQGHHISKRERRFMRAWIDRF